MRNIILIIILLVSPLVCFAQDAVTQASPQGQYRLDITTIVEGNTSFGLDLYDNLKEQKGNLFFSPYSISTALAMTYAGARSNTEKQMADVLYFLLDQGGFHPVFSELQAQLNKVQTKGQVELSVANALWAQKDYVFLSDFINLTNSYYEAGLNLVDFKTATEEARLRINSWAEEKTNNRIKDLIAQDVLGPLTRLVLTNAIYFKGMWESKFDKKNTKEAEFWLSDDKSVKTPMMTQKDDFWYNENEDLQVLEMPYMGNDLSMIILLPKKVNGLTQLEDSLSDETVNAWITGLRKETVKVFLPKFKMTSEFKLREVLASMGMSDAFSYGVADFSGMTGTKELFVSDVIHKAFIEVDEEGTEAAAVTAVYMEAGIAMPKVFKADHPFLFLIRHKDSGSILFFGRIVNPSV